MACCAEMSDGWVVIDHLSGAAKVPAIHTDGDRRDLRLDACRGLALWFIFIDRIPDNALAWLTLRNYGFSDATEVFVFVSGYTCMLAYGGALRKQGWPTTVTRALRRGWEIYTAFLLLLIAYFTLIWVVGDGSRYLDKTNTGLFSKIPVRPLSTPRYGMNRALEIGDVHWVGSTSRRTLGSRFGLDRDFAVDELAVVYPILNAIFDPIPIVAEETDSFVRGRIG